MRQSIERPTRVDEMYKQVMNITGRDPLPYGVAPNRQILGQIVHAAVEQKIIDEPIALEDLFANGIYKS
jgi:4,5-dihydroxyphthalate decarboxylase